MLPAIVALLDCNGVDKRRLELIVACTGPGSYVGLRVGVSLAKTLAYALDIPAVGVPRLRADAERWLRRYPRVCAVHRAGRSDFAIAAYERAEDGVSTLVEPILVAAGDLLGSIPADCAVVGEAPADLVPDREGVVAVVAGVAGQRRPLNVALLGLQALDNGASRDARDLLPVYLRPAVQQPPNR